MVGKYTPFAQHPADLDDYAAFNEEYAKHFPREMPVRTTVRADLVAGMHVEITIVAKQPRARAGSVPCATHSRRALPRIDRAPLSNRRAAS
jgi:hypothetical protein